MKSETAVLISIRPEWSRLILCGQKTLEVRKNRPELKPPFTCYIYQCLPKYGDWNGKDGHVVGEFVCNAISVYPMPQSLNDNKTCLDFWKRGCLKTSVILEYSGNKNRVLYGWRISDLRIYKTPVNLSGFRLLNGELVKRAPQSWCYVGKRDNKYNGN